MSSQVPQRSIYTAERRLAADRGAPAAAAPASTAGAVGGDFMDALDALRAQIRDDVHAIVDAKLQAAAAPAPAAAPPTEAEDMAARDALELLRREIREMSASIDRTKAEIKALYSSSA